LGNVLYGKKDLRGAANAYSVAVRNDPKYVKAQHNLSVALHELGDFEGALSAGEAALRLDPDDKSEQSRVETIRKLIAKRGR
jgi:tetratricopeptide (TPR) repeat protein